MAYVHNLRVNRVVVKMELTNKGIKVVPQQRKITTHLEKKAENELFRSEQ